MRNIEKNDNQHDEIYQKFFIHDKQSHKIDQISKLYEGKTIEDIEILKLQKLSSHKYIYILRKNMMK